jgi:hypothetical protein
MRKLCNSDRISWSLIPCDRRPPLASKDVDKGLPRKKSLCLQWAGLPPRRPIGYTKKEPMELEKMYFQ